MEVSMFAVIAVIAERYIVIVYSLRYVQVMTTKRTAILLATWGIPAILSVFRLIHDHYNSKLSAGEERTIFIIYTLLLEVAPIVLLIAATLHILLTARKLSLHMKALLTQVRFNVATNSVSAVKVPKMGLKASTVRLVTALVVIFVTCYGTEIYITICQMFELCVVSVGERTAFSLLLMANSVLNPLVYAFLKEDIKRETKALFCPRRRIYRSTMRFSQRCWETGEHIWHVLGTGNKGKGSKRTRKLETVSVFNVTKRCIRDNNGRKTPVCADVWSSSSFQSLLAVIYESRC